MTETNTNNEYVKTLVTTTDNPFDPFDDFANWNRWDQDHGYHTWSLVCRLAIISFDLSDREVDDEISAACEEIARFNLTKNYKKVSRKVSIESV